MSDIVKYVAMFIPMILAIIVIRKDYKRKTRRLLIFGTVVSTLFAGISQFVSDRDNDNQAVHLTKQLDSLRQEHTNALSQIKGQKSFPLLKFIRRDPSHDLGVVVLDNTLGEDAVYSMDGYFVKEVNKRAIYLDKFGPVEIPPKSALLQSRPFPMKDGESIKLRASFTTRIGRYNQTLFIESIGKETFRQAYIISTNTDTVNFKYDIEPGFPFERVPEIRVIKDILKDSVKIN